MSVGVNWETVLAIFAIVSMVMGLLKYVFYQLEQNRKHFDSRFKQHNEKLKEHGDSIKAHREKIQETREEMLDKNDLGQLNDNMNNLFKRVAGVSKDVSELSGFVKAKFNNGNGND